MRMFVECILNKNHKILVGVVKQGPCMQTPKVNGYYRFEQTSIIHLLRVDKNGTINEVWNNMKDKNDTINLMKWTILEPISVFLELFLSI